ncbi:hypothetical protein [Arenimonas alkanexedens]
MAEVTVAYANQTGSAERPLVLIGNGTGMVGLHALLRVHRRRPPPQLAAVR